MDTATVRKHFDYDAGTGRLLWRQCAHKSRIGRPAGSVAADGYLEVTLLGRRHVAVHRLVWLWHGRELPPELDHVNGVRSDSRIENLRVASKAENMRNVGLSQRNKSGIKGVHWERETQTWRAKLMVDRRVVDFGRFGDLELAGLVIAEARAKYHGAFARHN